MDFEWSVLSSKSVPDAAAAVEAALAERKFTVLWGLDVNATLEKKGLELDRTVRILEVCSAPRAKHAIETNPDVAYFLPCKIVVRSEAEGSRIGMARPTLMMAVLGDERLKELADEVEAVLAEAIQAAK